MYKTKNKKQLGLYLDLHGNFFTKNLILENDEQLINETGHFRIYQPSTRWSKLRSALHIKAEHS